MDPVLGRKVVERQQLLDVVGDLGDRDVDGDRANPLLSVATRRKLARSNHAQTNVTAHDRHYAQSCASGCLWVSTHTGGPWRSQPRPSRGLIPVRSADRTLGQTADWQVIVNSPTAVGTIRR